MNSARAHEQFGSRNISIPTTRGTLLSTVTNRRARFGFAFALVAALIAPPLAANADELAPEETSVSEEVVVTEEVSTEAVVETTEANIPEAIVTEAVVETTEEVVTEEASTEAVVETTEATVTEEEETSQTSSTTSVTPQSEIDDVFLGIIGELLPWSSETNQPSYWLDYGPHDDAVCYSYSADSSYGSITDSGKTVTLNAYGASWPGDHWELLVVKGGSVSNNVIVHPTAGVAYASPLNSGGEQSTVSHYIVCEGTTPDPFDENWTYPAPTCEGVTITFPDNLPVGQQGVMEVNVTGGTISGMQYKLEDDAYTTKYPSGHAGLTVFIPWSDFRNYSIPATGEWTVTQLQVHGTNYHWTGSVSCGSEEPQATVTFFENCLEEGNKQVLINFDNPTDEAVQYEVQVDGVFHAYIDVLANYRFDGYEIIFNEDTGDHEVRVLIGEEEIASLTGIGTDCALNTEGEFPTVTVVPEYCEYDDGSVIGGSISVEDGEDIQSVTVYNAEMVEQTDLTNLPAGEYTVVVVFNDGSIAPTADGWTVDPSDPSQASTTVTVEEAECEIAAPVVTNTTSVCIDGTASDSTVTITATPGVTSEYRINDGSWMTYTGTFTASAGDDIDVRHTAPSQYVFPNGEGTLEDSLTVNTPECATLPLTDISGAPQTCPAEGTDDAELIGGTLTYTFTNGSEARTGLDFLVKHLGDGTGGDAERYVLPDGSFGTPGDIEIYATVDLDPFEVFTITLIGLEPGDYRVNVDNGGLTNGESKGLRQNITIGAYDGPCAAPDVEVVTPVLPTFTTCPVTPVLPDDVTKVEMAENVYTNATAFYEVNSDNITIYPKIGVEFDESDLYELTDEGTIVVAFPAEGDCPTDTPETPGLALTGANVGMGLLLGVATLSAGIAFLLLALVLRQRRQEQSDQA